MSVHGPFQTEREAHQAAMRLGTSSGGVILSAAENRDMLIEACRAARVELGAFDRRIITWIAGYEDSSCAVLAGLIERAYRAGQEVTQ